MGHLLLHAPHTPMRTPSWLFVIMQNIDLFAYCKIIAAWDKIGMHGMTYGYDYR